MYTAENYIDFIETKRFDKISRNGMEVIVEGFRKLELELETLKKAEHNTAYAKCLKSLSKEIYGNDPSRDYSRDEVLNLVRKHFA